jgi:hypothetical protein
MGREADAAGAEKIESLGNALGTVGGAVKGALGVKDALEAPASVAPAPQSAAPSALDRLAAFAGSAKSLQERPARKPKFVPGKRQEPRSGHTVHDVFTNPEKLTDLVGKVSEWEMANPKRKLMGPHIQSMYPDMSPGQARRVAKRVHNEHQKFLTGKVESYLAAGAKKALTEKE